MKPTKNFDNLPSDPSIDSDTLLDDECECAICGVTLGDRMQRFAYFQPHSTREGDGALSQDTCNVCLDCRDAGVVSFPYLPRERAQQLEQKARNLRRLGNAEFLPLREYHAADPKTC